MSLTNLGNALLALAEHTGDIATLDQSVKTHRAAVTGTPSGDPDLPGRLANLGTALEAWYERTGNAGALREAAENIRAAIAAGPADRPARPITCPILGRRYKDCSSALWKPRR